MTDNVNNIPENETTPEVFEGPKNYIDFVVEDDVFDTPRKKFSVTKLLAMIFGIISGLLLLYYSVEIFLANREQINQYAQMGISLPLTSLIPVYFSIVLMFAMSLCPIAGGVLPKKYAKTSILLLAIPVSYTFVSFLPQLIITINYKLSFAESYQTILVSIAGILSLAAAILNMFAKENVCCCCDEAEVEFYEYEDVADEIEFEETEEAAEETAEEIEEAVQETTEE